MSDLNLLQNSIGIRFEDIALLKQALVHSSYINENPKLKLTSNERLEFLGDAVLGLVIAEKLYRDMPQSTEGDLTRLRASLVNREALAKLANTFALGDYMSLGKGEEAGGGRVKTANLAGALEALIAAVFLDRGLASARELILRLFSAELTMLNMPGTNKDYKSRLQELLQSGQQGTPEYHVIEAIGPPHSRTFTIEVTAGGAVLGRGTGKTKKSAEAEAARSALARLSNTFTE